MPNQLPEPKGQTPARPDRAALLARKEAAQRVEELKLRLAVLVDRHFEQSLRIIRSWIQDGTGSSGQKQR